MVLPEKILVHTILLAYYVKLKTLQVIGSERDSGSEWIVSGKAKALQKPVLLECSSKGEDLAYKDHLKTDIQLKKRWHYMKIHFAGVVPAGASGPASAPSGIPLADVDVSPT